LMSAPHGAYLKVESFDRFDGLSWHKSFAQQERQRLDNLTLEIDATQEANFQHTMTLVNDLGPYIPAAPTAVKLHFPADSIILDAYQNLKLPAKLQKDIVFTVESFISYHQHRPFAGTKAPPRDSDLALYEGFDQRISRLAEQVTQDTTDDMGKALRLETFLKQNYQYDANSIFTSQQNTPLDRFLFETRAGHCEFFASALAVMLRSQGIPSRLVTGFSATTMNPLTGYYEIYSLDGHAWVEAWIDGKGWMLLEATPPYELPRAETETVTAKQLQKYVGELRKYSALGNEDMPSLAEFWSFAADQFRAFMQYLRGLMASYITELTLTSAILLCSWIVFRRFKNTVLAWRLYWHVRRYQHRNTSQDAVFYMQHIHQLLRIRNQPRLPGDSIESFCGHAAFQGLDQSCLQRLSEHINRRFYENIQHELNGELFKKVFFHVYKRT
ncbi:MAG: transglutaminase domain-containing protein, partial [Gammaproteobacteria bacterium]